AALALVGIRIRRVAGHPLDDEVERRSGRQRVLDARLERVFIPPAHRPRSREWRRLVAGAIDLLVLLVGSDQVQGPGLVDAGDAVRIAEGAVGANAGRIVGSGGVPAGAARLAARDRRIIRGPVL